MQAAIKFANACEFDHRKAFHIPHFDFFEESASASPMRQAERDVRKEWALYDK